MISLPRARNIRVEIGTLRVICVSWLVFTVHPLSFVSRNEKPPPLVKSNSVRGTRLEIDIVKTENDVYMCCSELDARGDEERGRKRRCVIASRNGERTPFSDCLLRSRVQLAITRWKRHIRHTLRQIKLEESRTSKDSADTRDLISNVWNRLICFLLTLVSSLLFLSCKNMHSSFASM